MLEFQEMDSHATYLEQLQGHGDGPVVLINKFTLPPDQRSLKKLALRSAQMGTGDLSELQIRVDKTFIPAAASAGASKDPRELGIRVFHAFVDAR